LPWRKRLKRSGAFDEAPLQEERAREDAAADLLAFFGPLLA